MIPTPSSLGAKLGLLGQWGSSGTDALVTVEFGDFDHKGDLLWMRHAGAAKSIWARAQGADTRVVALSAYDATETIHVRDDSDIRAPADLRGKRVAVPRVPGRLFDVDRHVYLMPLASALASVGLGLPDVQLVSTDFDRPRIQNPVGRHEPRNFFEHAGDLFACQLMQGTVDAIVTLMPPRLPSDASFRKIYDARDDPRLLARGEPRLLTVSGELLRRHRGTIVDAVSRLLASVRWGATHPQETLLHLASELSISPQSMGARALDLEQWCDVDCNSRQVGILNERKNLMLAIRSIDCDFPVEAWVDPSIVAEARSFLLQAGTPSQSGEH